MKYLPLILVLVSCSQVSVKKDEEKDLVDIKTALNHAQMSYMQGCVDAYQSLKIPKSFEVCRDKSKAHRKGIEDILAQEPN